MIVVAPAQDVAAPPARAEAACSGTPVAPGRRLGERKVYICSLIPPRLRGQTFLVEPARTLSDLYLHSLIISTLRYIR